MAKENLNQKQTKKDYSNSYNKAYEIIADKPYWKNRDFNDKFDYEVQELTHKLMLKLGYKIKKINGESEYIKLNEQKENKKLTDKELKGFAGTQSLENEQDEYARNSKDDISILQNIIERMTPQGWTGKFNDNIFVVSYTCYVTGIALDKKDDLESDHKKAKELIQDTFKDKSGRKISLKEVGEDFDVQNSYTVFKQSRVCYSKFYEYKEKSVE